jgi:hypothetical protein
MRFCISLRRRPNRHGTEPYYLCLQTQGVATNVTPSTVKMGSWITLVFWAHPVWRGEGGVLLSAGLVPRNSETTERASFSGGRPVAGHTCTNRRPQASPACFATPNPGIASSAYSKSLAGLDNVLTSREPVDLSSLPPPQGNPCRALLVLQHFPASILADQGSPCL